MTTSELVVVLGGIPLIAALAGALQSWPGPRPALRSVDHPQADTGFRFTHPDWCRRSIAEALAIEPR